MEYTVKNKQIQDAIEFEQQYKAHSGDRKAFQAMWKSSTPEQMGINILYGYVSSLWEIADDPKVKVQLDLTYATVENLVNAVAYEFSAGLHTAEYTVEKNIEIAEKTIAAYLIFLAANEHGMKITVKAKKYRTETEINDTMSWIGYDITVGNVFSGSDLLAAIRGKTKYRGGHYYIYLDDICEAYRKLTGHDLRQDGVEDTECCF